MQISVLVGLAVMWALVLLPDFVRRFQIRRSADSIGTFSRHLSMLEQTNPLSTHAPRRDLTPPSQRQALSGRVAAPQTSRSTVDARSNVLDFAQRQQRSGRPVQQRQASPVLAPSTAAQRRQDIIVGLGALALLSLLAMFTFGGAMLYVHLVVDLLLISYLGLVLLAGRSERVRPEVSYLPAQQVSLASYSTQRRAASR